MRKLIARALDFAPRLLALRPVHLRRRCVETTRGAVDDCRQHFQIAHQFGGFAGSGLRLDVPACFQKQLRLVEYAFANRRRATAPGGIQLSGFSRLAVKSDENRGHALAIVQTEARYRDQIFHGHVRRDFAFAHLPLNGFGEKFDQRQPPRYPAHAPIEAPRQLGEIIVEAPFQFRQQPALFERCLAFGQTQRTVQHQSFGFAQRPDHHFDRVTP